MASNGRLDDSDLGWVHGYKLLLNLVDQTNIMIAAAARDGVSLAITQAYRTYAQQVSIFLARYKPQVLGNGAYNDVRYWNGTRYVRTSGAAAAVPGTSNHGWGQAIDFSTSSPGAIDWLTKNGSKYGWYRPSWTFKYPTIEPWHWEATPVNVSNPGGGTGGNVPTLPGVDPIDPIQPKGFLMALTDQQQLDILAAVGRLDERSAAMDRLWGDTSNRPLRSDEVHTWSRQTVEAVGRLDDQRFTVDQTHDWVKEIHAGVASLESLILSLDDDQIEASLANLSDETIAKIAVVVNDEAHRRSES